MLVTLGLDSQFAMVDVCVAAVMDEFPVFRKGWRKTMVVLFFCVLGFLLGIPILTEGGLHFFNLINDYSAWHGLLILALVFSIAMHYCYNFATTKLRFITDLEEMIGKNPFTIYDFILFLGKMNIVFRVYFYFMWFVGTPVMIIFILVNTFISYDTIAGYYGFDNPEDGIEIYPAWCNNFGTFFNYKFTFWRFVK